MKALNQLSGDELVSETKRLVREELRIGLEVLEHLREVEKRKLYLDRGHSSLFTFCIRELGDSEPQAQRRIDAMRALRDTPAIREKVRAGELNVTSVVQVQRFFRSEKKGGKEYSETERASLFQRVQGLGSREVERELIELSPESALPQERERLISETHTELRLVITEELREKLESLKALYSHRLKDGSSTGELLEILASDALKKAEPKELRADANSKPEQIVAPTLPKVNGSRPSRYIRRAVGRGVRSRDQGSCTYTDPKTGRRCHSRHYLQIDHIQPYSKGGTSEAQNLRLLCGPHNRLAWRRYINKPE